VVVVTHGGVTTYLLQAILGIPPAAPRWFDTAHCALTRVRLVPEGEGWDWPAGTGPSTRPWRLRSCALTTPLTYGRCLLAPRPPALVSS